MLTIFSAGPVCTDEMRYLLVVQGLSCRTVHIKSVNLRSKGLLMLLCFTKTWYVITIGSATFSVGTGI